MRTDFSESTPVREAPQESLWGSLAAGWNRFWFTPSDPTLLAVIRISCGLLALYTIFVYTWDLQNFFGKHAWMSHELRTKDMRQFPIFVQPLQWTEPQANDLLLSLKLTLTQYKKIVAIAEEGKNFSAGDFRKIMKELDLSEDQINKVMYIRAYQEKWKTQPPLPFPRDPAEEKAIDQYIGEFNVDPRLANGKGTADWSIWMHVTEPQSMMVVHVLLGIVTFLFAIGFCTRITSVLAWFAAMCYVHRSPVSIFGADTMMVILLTYLMIAPCGAVLSADRLIARWWRRRRSSRGPFATGSGDDSARPSVTATVALRMLQIHVCIIYAAAGLSKLQGTTWWTGNAIWGTIANSEFAPIQNGLYMFILRGMAQNLWLLQTFLAAGTYFTLFFEISYPFMIWGKKTRWLMLGMALVLHGFIGMLMGLKTFALIMLVMNAAFLPNETVHWLLRLFFPMGRNAAPAGQKPALALAGTQAGSADMIAVAARQEPSRR